MILRNDELASVDAPLCQRPPSLLEVPLCFCCDFVVPVGLQARPDRDALIRKSKRQPSNQPIQPISGIAQSATEKLIYPNCTPAPHYLPWSRGCVSDGPSMICDSIFSRSEPGGTGCPPTTPGTCGFPSCLLSAGGVTGVTAGATLEAFPAAKVSSTAARGPARMKDGDERRGIVE